MRISLNLSRSLTRSRVSLTAIALVAAVFFVAGTAYAVPVGVFADVKTADTLGDQHLQGDGILDSNNLSVASVLNNLQMNNVGTGLGSALLTQGSSSSVTHDFTPANPADVGSVLSAEVLIWLQDDFFGDFTCTSSWLSCKMEDEIARVTVDAQGLFGVWQGDPNAGLGTFLIGNVLGGIQQTGDSLQVVVYAVQGDFKFNMSGLFVTYDFPGGTGGGPGSAIPEPSAALLFVAGLVVVTRRRTTA